MRQIYTPNRSQLFALDELQIYLNTRRNKLTSVTLSTLRAQGYQVLWQRVRWTGGVGSYHIMRGGVLRVLVCSTKSGYQPGHHKAVEYSPGIIDYIHLPGHRHGYRYGWCITLPRIPTSLYRSTPPASTL